MKPSKSISSGVIAAAFVCMNLSIAFAEQRPTPLPADGRIKQFVYNENTVYRLDMHTNFISTVQFGKGEVVESIQVGDSASWQIIRLKRGDVISIKPLNVDAITNMTVYTNRRVYSFELRAHRGRERTEIRSVGPGRSELHQSADQGHDRARSAINPKALICSDTR